MKKPKPKAKKKRKLKGLVPVDGSFVADLKKKRKKPGVNKSLQHKFDEAGNPT